MAPLVALAEGPCAAAHNSQMPQASTTTRNMAMPMLRGQMPRFS